MFYTLISSIGTGMYKKEGGYRQTVYQFADGQKVETALFLTAILQAKKSEIKKVVLIGTRTSSWDALIPDGGNADLDLWGKIQGECLSSDGISDTLLKKLQAKLPEWHDGLPFALKAHTSCVDKDTAGEVFAVYSTIAAEIADHTDILFDITHGFRSMPVLIYQALQLDAIKLQNRRIDLIYGEYIDQEKISHVRDLSPYWDFYEITAAEKLFTDKLDGKLLAEKIQPHWKSGAECLRRLSEIIECNFAFQLPETLNQIKNAIEKKAPSSDAQPWVTDAKNELAAIYKKLFHSTTSETLRAYSRLLESKGLLTQAVITLQIALETAVTEKYGAPENIGDYDWWQETGKSKYIEIKKQIESDDGKSQSEPLWQIENLRNGIAHGGARDRKSGSFAHIANLPKILKQGNAAADQFLLRLKKVTP
ncbi:CRISPR-associated protein [Planctomycetales bacterium]|nr:CRISPR-associated protein [Planctomycetales bacterium]GHT04388.1 CRISPR-associated protein [Planctomycetales bacterium]